MRVCELSAPVICCVSGDSTCAKTVCEPEPSHNRTGTLMTPVENERHTLLSLFPVVDAMETLGEQDHDTHVTCTSLEPDSTDKPSMSRAFADSRCQRGRILLSGQHETPCVFSTAPSDIKATFANGSVVDEVHTYSAYSAPSAKPSQDAKTVADATPAMLEKRE